MFCMHCGKPTEGDQPVCPQCAAQQAASQAPQPVAEPAPQPAAEPAAPQQPVFEQSAASAPQQPVFEQPVYEQPAPQQPVWQETPAQPEVPAQDTFVLNTPDMVVGKKKKGNKLVTAIVAVVAVAALVVGGIIGWPYISKLFNKPASEGEAQDSLTNTIADPDGALITTYSALRQLMNTKIDPTEAAAEATLRLQIDEDTLETLLDLALADVYGDTSELTFLSDISIAMKSNAKDGCVAFTGTAILGETEIVTIEGGTDLENGVVWFRLPDLSDEYVIGEFDPSYMDMDMDELTASTEMMNEIGKLLPEEEVVIRLLEKYLPLALEQMGDAEKKDVKLEVNGIENSVTAVTYGLSQKTALKMAVACLKEAQKDEDIADILNAFSDYTGADADMILEQIPDVIESLEAQLEEADEENVIELTTYTSDKGALVGLSLTVDGEEMATAYSVSDGDKFACTIEIPAADLSFTGEGTSKAGILNATYTLEMQGMEFGTIELKDFDSKGMTKGTILITPSEEVWDMLADSAPGISALSSAGLSLELSFEGDENASTVSIALLAKGKDMIRLTASGKTTTPTTVKVPTNGISMDDEEAIMNWVMGMDFDKVLNNLREGGVPNDLVDMLEQGLEMALNPTVPEEEYPEYDEELVGDGGFIEEAA